MQLNNVTVFGGSGFLGRYLVKRLAADGMRVRAAVRDPEAAAFLKPMGEVGQVMPVQANIRHRASVEQAVAGADAVVNLVGILYQSGPQRFDQVHAEGAGLVAGAAAEAGVQRLVQVSAIGADRYGGAHYARSKAAGEAAVQEAYPAATIVRPSVVFGPDDNFFNLFARLATLSPALPLVGGGETRFQPVYVGDVAEGIQRILHDDATAGRTYEFGGPRVYSFRELMELVLEQTGRRRLLLPLPFAIAKIQALFLQMAPRPLLTMDQVELLKQDNVVDDEAPGLPDLGITPTPADAVLPSYMHRYRRGGRQPAAPADT